MNSNLKQRLLKLDQASEGAFIPSFHYDTLQHPRSVQIEITTLCNLKCEYCTHRHLPEKANLPLSRFCEILDRIDMSQVDNLDFTGLGEPLLHPDLPEMIRLARLRAIPTHIRVVSNGTVSRFERLCDAGITSIAFSIDSLDPAKFARNRGGCDLQTVLDNLEKLVSYREKGGLDHLSIKIKSVLVDEPYGEAERLMAYSAKLGLEMPHFSCLDSRDAAQQSYGQRLLDSNWAQDGAVTFSIWANARWRELAPQPALERSHPKPTQAERAAGFMNPILSPPPSLCRWAVDAAFISSTGECLSCCEQMIDIPRRLWGSLASFSLGELWTNELFWGYRLPLSLNCIPIGCVGCSWAPADGLPIDSLVTLQTGRTIPQA